MCRLCEWAIAKHIDHIIPLDDGGHPWDARNLRPLCAACHNRVRSPLMVCVHGYRRVECPDCPPEGLRIDGGTR